MRGWSAELLIVDEAAFVDDETLDAVLPTVAATGGDLAVGSPADLVIVDPERSWLYDPAKGYSKSRNSPWAGQMMQGRVVATIVDGRLVYHVDKGVLVP